MEDPDFTATAFCPLCCSTVDVEGTGEQTFDCARCDLEWTMIVDPEQFRRYSAV